MKVIRDIFSSVRGNLIVRSKDPVLGAFLVSWCIFNWNKLAILFWGAGDVEQRVKNLSEKMSVIAEPSILWVDKDLLFFPLVLAGFSLFILPWLSLWVNKKQNKVILSQHTHAVDLEIKRIEEQKNFNKLALRANPEKEFLAEEIKNDLQREKERSQRRHRVQDYIDQKAKAAKAEADIKVSEAEKKRIDVDSKKRQEKIEKNRFEAQATIHQSTIASARFPAIYQLMHMLSKSLREDNIKLSLDGVSNTVAALFGYNSAEEMMSDEKFRTEELNKIKYLYHDPIFLSKRLEEIIEEESSDNEDLSSELLFYHLQIMLEEYPLEFLSDESLAEKIGETVEGMKYDILSSDELSGAMAETDTIFEDLELEVDSFEFDTAFEVKMSGYASGYHRKETGVSGRDLSVQVTATAAPVVGRYGLLDFQLEVIGQPADYE